MPKSVRWIATPADKDYAAAARFLRLLMPDEAASNMAEALRHGELAPQRANDLLRASGLLLLPPTDPEVAKDLAKVKKGTPLSPVLLVRGDLKGNRNLTVADGYHRICASYHVDPDAEVPCQIADLLVD
jgi:hypothetical protein